MNIVMQITGEINEESFHEFSSALLELELTEQRDGLGYSVLLELSSAGGTAYDALAFCSRIRLSTLDITVRAYGYVASAAVLLLAAGDKREMTKEAWVMLHEDFCKIKGSVVDVEREAKHFRRLENQWVQILEELTNTPKETWEKLHKETTYLTAQECLSLGLVDVVV